MKAMNVITSLLGITIMADKITGEIHGGWRGISKHYYDTDRPTSIMGNDWL